MVEGLDARPMSAMLLPGAWVLSVEPGREAEVADALNDEPGVEFAEPDYLIALVPCETGDCAEPANLHQARKWDLHNAGSITLGGVTTATGKADADIDWMEAYDALGPTPAGKARVGIVDTGIRASHLEMAGRVVAAHNFASGYPATLIEDRDGHGSHVAGIATGRGVQASGVAYGPGIELINAKACERYLFPDGVVRVSCANSSIANAIVFATDQGADVINLSLGGPPNIAAGPAVIQTALQYARARNVIPFCATGNDNYFNIAFPARFPECVAVAATNWADGRASYSNYGPGTALAAPGGDGGAGFPLGLIVSAGPTADNHYVYKAGTSMATPQVVGLAALLISQGVSKAEVVERMRATADDLGAPGADGEFGAGRINVCRALDPAQVTVTMPGQFNRNGNGHYTVVIHNAGRFDPSRLDEANITLGGTRGAAGGNVELKGDAYRAELLDVDADGDLDLELKFRRPDVAPSVASGQDVLTLRGNVGCRRVAASQTVRVNH
jgi:hypothetical protein